MAEGTGPSERVHPTILEVGTRINGFIVDRLIGQGGSSQVYRARDTRLGRRVALKLMRAVDPQRVDLLFREAKTTAKLSHPNIVNIYSYAHHGDRPYLELEYLDGDSLARRHQQSPLAIADACNFVCAVARALEFAHRENVLHCDLKPANLIVPRDGRLRVVDFGLARAAGAPGKRAGTPAFMAPEQWCEQRLVPATDIWALGATMLALIGVRDISEPCTLKNAPLPLEAWERWPDLVTLAPRIAELCRGMLHLDPASRPSAEEVVRSLSTITVPVVGEPPREPFVGLAAFDESHATEFYGRGPEVDEVLERLRLVPMLAVVGPSGSGKSSLLHAGVLPALKARGPWTIIHLRPGKSPFVHLARKLLAAQALGAATASREEIDLLAAKLTTPSMLGFELERLAGMSKTQVCLLIDQLEEIFTHSAPEETQQAFLSAVLAAADDAEGSVRVIVSIRDDFVGRVRGLEQVWVIRPLADDAIREAVKGPLRRRGYRLEDPAMLDDMVESLKATDVGLPLLQFACTKLWDRRDKPRRLLLRSIYDGMNGVTGALAAHGETTIQGMSESERRCARSILLALVTPQRTRRVVPESELLALEPEQGRRILNRLIERRLLISRVSELSGTHRVELAHEALIKGWAQLAAWLEESREELALKFQLEQEATYWQQHGRRPEATWPEDEIKDARRRLHQSGTNVNAVAMAFLEAGEARAEASKRRRRWIVGTTASVLFIVAIAATLLAVKLSSDNRELRDAGANIGRFALVLAPFDWDDVEQRPTFVSADTLPELDWVLHYADLRDSELPGEPFDPAWVRRLSRGVTKGEARFEIEAPGILAWLEIKQRGRAGETCTSSWLRLRSLPGYAVRSRSMPALHVPVPTCQATRAGMIEVPAGEFIWGGRGEPPTTNPEDALTEETLSLGRFWLDRTEASNALFELFARTSSLSGYPRPTYPRTGELREAGLALHPATSLNALTASAFCRFLGRRLPSSYEWVKAARGGLWLDAEQEKLNPAPRRLFPWGPSFRRELVNIAGAGDRYASTSPVNDLSAGAGPYGHLNLAGNASEWTSSMKTETNHPSLRAIRGGDWYSPEELQHYSTAFENAREPNFFAFSIGVRCALGSDSP